MSTQHEKVSTQHVHAPAEDDGMTAEHVEGLAEEKMSCAEMGRIWQEGYFALADDGSGCYASA